MEPSSGENSREHRTDFSFNANGAGKDAHASFVNGSRNITERLKLEFIFRTTSVMLRVTFDLLVIIVLNFKRCPKQFCYAYRSLFRNWVCTWLSAARKQP